MKINENNEFEFEIDELPNELIDYLLKILVDDANISFNSDGTIYVGFTAIDKFIFSKNNLMSLIVKDLDINDFDDKETFIKIINDLKKSILILENKIQSI